MDVETRVKDVVRMIGGDVFIEDDHHPCFGLVSFSTAKPSEVQDLCLPFTTLALSYGADGS
jgi:hypothetical protein